ncbi:hypothetical protein ETAA8_27160 [Anatilimnocola aggregata]|uniref:Uncharacterized protein n=1 Tax=Anatilimnocola aggregata TaxID=2528021 RepID=A0A517YBK5_9BACT|nr:hypothetical protein ETAA8_27160 [Anatilimnocola aggregata]
MPNTRLAAPIFVALAMILIPIVYVGSYLAIVDPNPSGVPCWGTGSGHYGYRGIWVDRAFWPLEQIDRKVRPGAWNPPETDLPFHHWRW